MSFLWVRVHSTLIAGKLSLISLFHVTQSLKTNTQTKNLFMTQAKWLSNTYLGHSPTLDFLATN
jgi:hypothetical protein